MPSRTRSRTLSWTRPRASPCSAVITTPDTRWCAGCLQPHQGQHNPGAAPPTGTRTTQHRASRERACSVHRYYVPTAERRTGTRAPYRSHVQTAERDSPNRDVEVTPFSARLGLIWQVKVTPFSARSRNCLSRPNMAAARLSRPNLAAASLGLYGYMRSSTLLPGASERSPSDLLRAISKRSPSDLQAISVRSPPRDLSEAGLRLCARHGALDPQQLIGHRGELLRLVERL